MEQVTTQAYSDGREVEEEEVSGFLLPETSSILSVCHVGEWPPRLDADATLKHIASCLTTKWKQPYSRTCGYVKSTVAITLAHATHH